MRHLSVLLICIIALTLWVNYEIMAADNFAVEFKGDQKTRVIAPDSPSLDITDQLTMEAWVYPTATSGSAIIINKEDSWECALQNNILKAAIKAAEWAWHGGGEVPLNKWTFVAVSFDGKEHHTYVNGKYEASRPNAGKIQATNETFHVGWRICCNNEPFTGIIDEVRVSSVARYQKNKDFDVPDREFEPDDDTAVLYHFNEGKGTVASDSSKNKNDGDVDGGAKYVKNAAPIKPAAVEAGGKLSITWGSIKTSY
jgi:hypothetical protein